MSQQKDGFDPVTDPIGAWRQIRDANLDAWSKGMASMVNTEAFSKVIGMQMDALLAATSPVKQVVDQYTETYLTQMNLPTRNEIVSLAKRMTTIEMRLDDMDAMLDEIVKTLRKLPSAIAASLPESGSEPVATAQNGGADAPAKPAARRTRKTDEA